MQLPWKLDYEAGGEIVAQHNGWYDSAGLIVELIPWEPGIDVMQQIPLGNAHISVASADMIIKATSQGQKLRILATLLQRSPLGIITISPEITHPEHLRNKRISLFPGHELFVQTVLMQKNMTLSDVHLLSRTATSIADLKADKTDAIVGFVSSELEEIAYSGVIPTFLPAYKYGYDCPTHVYFTTDSVFQRYQEKITSFISLTMQGWRSAFVDPKHAAQYIMANSTDSLDYEKQLYGLMALKFLAAPDGYLNTLGSFSRLSWENIQDILIQAGAISEVVKIDSTLFTSISPAPRATK